MKMTPRQIRFAMSFACLLVAAGLLLAPRPAGAITSSWITDGNGSWGTPGNWNNGVPTNAGDVAYITNAITSARTIMIDTGVTVGAIRIGGTGITNAFTVNLGGGGTLTMDSGSSSNALLQQNLTSSKASFNANITLNSDLDVVNRATSATYFNIVSAISGNHNVNINTGVSSGAGTPYMGGANTFVGNLNLYYGQVLLSGNDSFFGNTGNGTRQIAFYNNASIRNNGSLAVLGANRQFVIGSGGGTFSLHTRNLTLATPAQLTGSNTFTISTDAGGNTNNVFIINSTNDGFTGTMLLSDNVALKLGAGGNVSNCPLIHLSATTCLLDVTNKSSGYSVPANQVLAGIGRVTGGVSVTTATATIHPGSYALPGPVTGPGVLTLNNGLTMSGGGVYAWDLAQLKDDATGAPGITTFSSINATSGSVNLSGGSLAIGFLGTVSAQNPNSTNGFWKSNNVYHVWTILTATNPPSGTLAIANGTYSNGVFKTQVSGNNLQLIYGPLTATHQGTAVIVR